MHGASESFSSPSASAWPSSALCLPPFFKSARLLTVSAAGLIPLAIGIGFFVDYALQKRELARFGLEVAADPPPNNPPN